MYLQFNNFALLVNLQSALIQKNTMKILVYSTRIFEKEALNKANQGKFSFEFTDIRLNTKTFALAKGYETVIVFSVDELNAEVLQGLWDNGVRFIAFRAAGFNNIDLPFAKKLGFKVARVPAYSPYAIAEHTVALMMALNRKIIKAHNRVNELNFDLNGLVGFDVHDKTVGVIGTGKIGEKFIKILNGFGCKILAFDISVNPEISDIVEYTTLENILTNSDIISLHVPLNEKTKYLINENNIQLMKHGVMLLNTSRGALIDTKAVINALKTGKIGYLGIDVYEEESELFFVNHSVDFLQDEVISRLMTFKNVLITGHQAFLTETALRNIADTTIQNIGDYRTNTVTENFL